MNSLLAPATSGMQYATGSNVGHWLLWGGVGLFLVALYMAVYFLIRTRWGHASRPVAEDSTGDAEPGPTGSTTER